jgi:integrase/recombinase XerD
MKPTNFAQHLTKYLTTYLPGQKGFSANTIKSYRDAFRLLLQYCFEIQGVPPEKLTIERIDYAIVDEFLSWLETDRNNSVSSRNQRLAAIHAFFRYLQCVAPEFLLQCQQVLDIHLKKCPRPELCYLTGEEMSELLSKPNQQTARGRRDLLMLSLLYDSAARVAELINLTVGDVRLDEYPSIKLTGKGNKARRVPLMSNTVALLKQYIKEHGLDVVQKSSCPLFPNPQNNRFTRAGITYILQKYAPAYHEKITPHILRHTKAMHLLQAGVNIVYIRDILGHVDVNTTEIYARADTEMKRMALEKAQPSTSPHSEQSWQSNLSLMDWLKSLA